MNKVEEALAKRTVLQTQLLELNEKIIALDQIATVSNSDVISVVLYCNNNKGIKIQSLNECESNKLKAVITEILEARVADV